MKKLQESDVLRIMREEWQKKVKKLTEIVDIELKTNVKKDGNDKQILSPELKVLHKKSGIRYTIDSVGSKDIILRTPENEKFLIDNEQLEADYQLD